MVFKLIVAVICIYMQKKQAGIKCYDNFHLIGDTGPDSQKFFCMYKQKDGAFYFFLYPYRLGAYSRGSFLRYFGSSHQREAFLFFLGVFFLLIDSKRSRVREKNKDG